MLNHADDVKATGVVSSADSQRDRHSPSPSTRTITPVSHTNMPRPVALVTGSTSGIGSEIARRLLAEGLIVVISGRSSTRGRQFLTDLGGAAHFIQADLAQPGAPARLIKDVLRIAGRIDVLVNNAAIDHTAPLIDVATHEIRRIFEINTFAAIACLQAAAHAMRDQGNGGTIVNITSRLASVGVPTMGIYGASKGAMLAMTIAAAVELAPYNIRVNAVAPGMTRTPLFDEWLARQANPATAQEAVAGAIPLGRIAEPRDIAAAVAFLASPEASYITGASLPVDGGYLAQ